MAGFSAPTREDDPIHVVRTIVGPAPLPPDR